VPAKDANRKGNNDSAYGQRIARACVYDVDELIETVVIKELMHKSLFL